MILLFPFRGAEKSDEPTGGVEFLKVANPWGYFQVLCTLPNEDEVRLRWYP